MNDLVEVASLYKRFPVGKRAASLKTLFRPAQGEGPMLHAVDDVSFAIGRGETIGLVGESGCGKSTLVRLLMRLLDPTAGAITFDGTEIAEIPAKRFGRSAHRRRIQMVFQDATDSLNPRFTAFAAIADPIRRLDPLDRAALKARVEELAEMVGLPKELLTRFPHQLSGGQKARVGIARAIAVRPELLVLDEPTSALDVSVQVLILHLLEHIKAQLGTSYLFVSHDMNVVRLLCDRVLVMYLGRIVESGPAREVFENPAHPYTKALLAAIPSLDSRGRKQVRLAGEPMSPIDPPTTVCRFASRCPKAAPLCTTEMPLVRPVGDGRIAACHFPENEAAAESPAAAARA
jgi:oligopeptide/dipeptide ABC transporter ATP-binding protein